MKRTFSPPADNASGRPERPLTARETEVLRYLSIGMGTPAIARELSIARATVRNHVQRILAKLRVHSQLAAVARGYAAGLIVAPTRLREEPPGPPV